MYNSTFKDQAVQGLINCQIPEYMGNQIPTYATPPSQNNKDFIYTAAEARSLPHYPRHINMQTTDTSLSLHPDQKRNITPHAFLYY